MNGTRLLATVAICTYNGAVRLGMVINALAAQMEPRENWEILVVDNASTDNTSEMAKELLRKHAKCSWQVVREPVPGLSHARRRAALAANGGILCFLDDDNIPSPTFVGSAIRAFVARPKAGVVGSRVKARWETPPTALAEAVAGFALAICDREGSAARIEAPGGGVVGAGLCVRREVLQRVFDGGTLATAVTDRKGSDLIGGGDLAISIAARKLGWETWYDPTLMVEHCLLASRMEKSYLLRLYEGIGRGQAVLRTCYDWKARTPLAWLIGTKDLVRWVRGRIVGPPPKLRLSHLETADDLHALRQRQTLARAFQAMRWPL